MSWINELRIYMFLMWFACIYLGDHNLCQVKRLRVLETELFPLFADMMQCRDNRRVHPYLAQPLTSPLTWTWASGLWAASPRLGWPPSGDGQEPSKFLGYVGVATVITSTSTYWVCSGLFCSQLPGGHSPRPELSRSCLERSSTHTFIPPTPQFANLSSHQLFPQT